MRDKAWYVEQHRAMWNWIADRVEKCETVCDIVWLKGVWCRMYGYDPRGNCFACEYRNRFGGFCHGRCLFDWGTGSDFTGCTDGYYEYCKTAETWQEQAELARLIANLPVREEV